MDRKLRKSAWDQGSIKEIWLRFIVPLLPYKPEDMSLDRWLDESIFQIDERPFHTYKARQGFSLPGLYLKAPNEKYQGIGERTVRKGERLFVRIEPNGIFHVEKDYNEQVYELSLYEWNNIRVHLENT